MGILSLFRKPKLESGQIWIYKTKNPFKKDSIMLIREIEDGYVRYIDPKYEKEPDFYSCSSSIDMFLCGSERIS